MTVSEAAIKWGVSERRVHKYVKDGRITGAARFGAAWMIPATAEKPDDPRRGKKALEQLLPLDIAYVNTFAFAPFPRDNPDAILATVPKRLRPLPEMGLAYLRGDFNLVKRKYLETEGDDALKLSAAAMAASATIGVGDYDFYLEIEAWLRRFTKANISEGANAVAEWTLGISYLGAYAPNMVPDWLKNGNFENSPPPGAPELAYARVKYFQCTGQYESMLATAQTALAFCTSKEEMSVITVYLNTARAIACCGLDRMDEAEACLLDTMRSCLPHGFVTPFVELALHFGGLLEQCLKREFPEYHNAIIKGWPHSFKSWMTFHNQFTKDNITHMLSLRDYEIARQVVQGESRKKIAEKLHISPGTVRNRMQVVYETLLITGKHTRKALEKYIL